MYFHDEDTRILKIHPQIHIIHTQNTLLLTNMIKEPKNKKMNKENINLEGYESFSKHNYS